jgi:ABC-type polar amino acid transport system ATPase subunit/transposase
VKASKIFGVETRSKEAFVAHRNARLNVNGRRLLVQRVRHEGWKVAHVAAAMGISRQCAHRWVKRFDEEGLAGLEDRSSRPHLSPQATPPTVVAAVLRARRAQRCGPAQLAQITGVAERTISRILAREGVARLDECDPMTGEVIRASKATTIRYERARPGELVHLDVKKLGKIPQGGGWRAKGGTGANHAAGHAGVGWDFVHSMVDDHSRLAYSEVLADEKGATCAAFLRRAATAFAEMGIDEGSIWLFGHDLGHDRFDEDLVRRHTGMVFQSFNLFPHLSVLENVTLAPRRVLGISKDEAEDRAMGLLDRIGLREKATDYPDRLSGGQQQRVAIVRSLAMDPSLLLLDEITSALDPELVSEALALVGELAEQGMTTVLATHEMSFAREVADAVFFLGDGRIIESGSPSFIFEDPQEEATKRFLQRIIEADRL